MPYSPLTWVNDQVPSLNQANLNHLTDELQAQAAEKGIANTLPNWVDGAPPALTDAAPLNEIERVTQAVAASLGLNYTPTSWSTGWAPARNAQRFNQLEQQVLANRVAIDGAVSSGTAYFVEDWSTGRAETVRWDDLYSYSTGTGGPGVTHCPVSTTPDGRVAVVNDPVRAGRKALRCEIRDSDPPYQLTTTIDKSECTSSYSKTWGPSGFSVGTIRWFDFEYYFPYNATEKWDWPHNATMAMFGLHPPGGSPAFWSVNHVEWNPYQFNSGGVYQNWQNVYLNFHGEGGTWGASPNPNDRNWPLMQMTDASGNRVNHNRWVRLVFGIKYNPDNTGWLEIWIDDQTPGVLRNVVPRVARPTMWNVDVANYQSYFKIGVYDDQINASYPSGGTVMYFGRTTIGTDRPF